MSADNPLLTAYPLPDFDGMQAADIAPALEARLAEGRACIEQVAGIEQPAWDNVVYVLEQSNDALSRTWSPVRHLNSVADTAPWREAYNAGLPKLSEYYTELGQNEALYAAYQQIADSEAFAEYTPAQQAVIEQALRDFTLSGVALDAEAKARYKTLATELSELTSQFSQNVLDATQAWKKHLTRADQVAGLPAPTLTLARENAEREGLGGWLLTLDYPIYSAVMSYAEDRALREEVYTAFATRASDEGPNAGQWDNGPLIEAILAKRHEMARLVGFATYAEYSLARKMAQTPAQIASFLMDLAQRAKPVAAAELASLRAHAREHLGLETLEAWDITFASEHLRKARFDLSPEELRAYFPMPRVLKGLFEIVGRLFEIDVVARDDASTWNDEVEFFEIRTRDGTPLGQFYLDAYARTGKRGGAWMDECVVRRRTTEGLQLPVAYLNCNFSPPAEGRPSLLEHAEVLTLFHEFGHGLHHLLTQVEHAAVSGINGVPWDAVELPSQFLENWCWLPEGLDLITGHVDSGEPLPGALIERLREARDFLAGMAMVRQIEFALFDLRIHAQYDATDPAPIYDTLTRVREEVAVVQPPSFNRFAHGFSHIFAGGYAAGYYSYKWAEVLAADAFDRFEQEGTFDLECGRAFRDSILAKGGSEDAMALFRAFRGRDPEIGPLLRQSGITVDETTSS